MLYYLIKLFISAGMIVLVSEVSKRQPGLGGLLASLPLTALLGILWIYTETRDLAKISAHCVGIFWYVLPSLPMFLLLPWFIQLKMPFGIAFVLSCVITIVLYLLMVKVLSFWHIAI
jgi:uncharacterized membrane protein (GlpM family)